MHVHVILLCCAILQTKQIEGSLATLSNDSNCFDGDKNCTDGERRNENTSQETLAQEHTLHFTKQTNGDERFKMTRLLDVAQMVSVLTGHNIKNLFSKLIITYNNLLNTYSKQATVIAQHMAAINFKLKKLEQDLNTLCADLAQKYETSKPDIKFAVKILLTKALAERELVYKRRISEYRVLQCDRIMGMYCETDQDCVCYGCGCTLLCKKSGIFWWKKSVCR
ncbi:uncharacterized protein LOC132727395 [Ruditapes philippinarum]|uniref:uncharacterized protein LOC132727395 n=1 Tax=Ruditapes philippinarum TaxID=129788 RepID=UPI00295AA3B9|nr:uncharacterized protein LOC132727395 [Ruditapes philippinarum]